MIVVLSALLALVAAQSCSLNTCVTEGEACDRPSGVGTFRLCYGGYGSCSGNSTGPNYRCFLDNPSGSYCDADGDCQTGFDGFSYVCESNMCVLETGLGIGVDNDECRNDDDCVGVINCVDGHCNGLGVGEDCNNDDECKHNMYCGANACRRRKFDDGDLCVSTQNCNHFWETCGNDNGVDRCYDLASRGERHSCASDNDCEDGLYCSSYDNRCAVAPVFDYNNVAFSNCSSEPDACNGGESASCSCSQFNPQRMSVCVASVQDCHHAFKLTRECLEDHECHYLSSINYNASCATRHCSSAFQAYDDCISQTQAARVAFGAAAATCFPSYGASYSAAGQLLSFF